MEEAHDLIGEHSTADEPERIALQEHAASLAGDAALASVAASSLHEALQQGLLPRGAVAAAVRAALPTRSAATARDDAALTAGLSLLDLLMSSGEEALLLQRDGDAVVAALAALGGAAVEATRGSRVASRTASRPGSARVRAATPPPPAAAVLEPITLQQKLLHRCLSLLSTYCVGGGVTTDGLRNLVRHDGSLLALFKDHPAGMGVRWGGTCAGRQKLSLSPQQGRRASASGR